LLVDDVLLAADLCIYDCDKVIVLLSSYPNEFMSGKNNSIVVQDALFNFILNSNKNVKKSKNNAHLHQFSNQSVFTSQVYTLKHII